MDDVEGADDAAAEPGAPAHWEAIRRLYELTETPIAEILGRYGVTAGQLRWRRRSEEWAARPSASGVEKHAPARVRMRMLALHDTLLGRLEKRTAEGAHFRADEALALATLGEAYVTLSEMVHPMPRRDRKEKSAIVRASREKKTKDAGLDAADDAWFRAELKKRIHQIREAIGREGLVGRRGD